MRIVLSLSLAVALAACDRPSPVADEAENAEALPSINKPAASPTGGPPPSDNRTAANGVATPASAIPAALQGRWGLTPGDCMATHGNEGLLVVSATGLRFYESVAVPASGVEATGDSISGIFDFTGEGQSWSKHLRLQLRDDKLIRMEREPVATFRYVRCD